MCYGDWLVYGKSKVSNFSLLIEEGRGHKRQHLIPIVCDWRFVLLISIHVMLRVFAGFSEAYFLSFLPTCFNCLPKGFGILVIAIQDKMDGRAPLSLGRPICLQGSSFYTHLRNHWHEMKASFDIFFSPEKQKRERMSYHRQLDYLDLKNYN